LLAGEDNLSFVSEVNLYNFIAESKHDGMFSFHPFFHVTKMGLFRGLDELDF
jgi:hypothetical protein